MGKENRPFRFKKFEMTHHRSSMKIGVDAVVLGAWADITDARSILDAGCGCGIISLMCAQRNPEAKILAIDIDAESVNESFENFKNSPWSERLIAKLTDFNLLAATFTDLNLCENKFDYIISNPPYFDSGIVNPESVRLRARHQDDLSPTILLEKGVDLLSESGKIGLVIPNNQGEELIQKARGYGLYLQRLLKMRGREGREFKRFFLEFGKEMRKKDIGTLSIEYADGSFTKDYISLCKDFYLKF